MPRLALLGLVASVLVVGGAAHAAPDANGLIAYVSGVSGRTSIWTVEPDGSRNDYLVDGTQPSWSPEGTRLVYFGPDAESGMALYVVNADGRDRHPLLAVRMPASDPDWSPDGRHIAFKSGGDIYVADADGHTIAQLTTGAPIDANPAWTSDGRTIAFDRDGGLWLMNADGHDQRTLGIAGSDPQVSPDGNVLAFVDSDAVYTVDMEAGTAPRQVSPQGSASYVPAWSPDGSQLAFVAEGALCTTRVTGGAPRAVRYGALPYGLDWRPAAFTVGREARYPCAPKRWDLALAVRPTRKRAAVGDRVAFSVVLANRGPHPAVESTAFWVRWSEEAEYDSVDIASSSGGECSAAVRIARQIGGVICRPGVVFPGRPYPVATITLRVLGPGPERVTAEMDAISRHDTNAGNDRDAAAVRVGGCTITGTTGADVITGTRRRDVICGLDGHDVIRGMGGNDEIWSGPRDDVVEGGPGDDTLFGGGGDDDLDGGSGDDVVWGGFGRDTVVGAAGDDALDGGDRLGHVDPSAPSDSDVLDGGLGADVLSSRGGSDLVHAGPGDDIVFARDGLPDRVDCGRGRDRMRADRYDRARHCERVSRA